MIYYRPEDLRLEPTNDFRKQSIELNGTMAHFRKISPTVTNITHLVGRFGCAEIENIRPFVTKPNTYR